MPEVVDVKQGELLETPTDNTEDNQQPSSEDAWDVQPDLGF